MEERRIVEGGFAGGVRRTARWLVACRHSVGCGWEMNEEDGVREYRGAKLVQILLFVFATYRAASAK
jgi:hypothetical protein